MTTIGERLSHVLKIKRLSMDELADILETSRHTLYSIRSGRTKSPGFDLLSRFKKIEINPEWLMKGEGEMSIEGSSMEANPISEGDSLFDTVKAIEESFKEVVAEQKEIIKDQRYIIDNLKSQLIQLGKGDLSKKKLHVTYLNEKTILFRPLRSANSLANSRRVRLS